MSFTYKVENDEKLPFLDILVSREDKEFPTNITANPLLAAYIPIFRVFFTRNL